ncbi:MAG TPA: hypothetical protein V6C95_21305 [Coleofasciculaceae cyanobacterium]
MWGTELQSPNSQFQTQIEQDFETKFPQELKILVTGAIAKLSFMT